MFQDNDPWGKNPKNVESNELTSFLKNIKKMLGFNKNQENNNSNQPPIPVKTIVPLAGVAIIIWLSSGIYVLPEGFHGVEQRFGRYTQTAINPGFNYHLPSPIGRVIKVDIGSIKNLTVGKEGSSEGQMLTSDENIVEVGLSVQYRIGAAEKYLFNVKNPEKVLRETFISSIREVVGGSSVDYVLTDGRAEWPAKVMDNLVNTLAGFNIGFEILRVELRDAKAPAAVQAAFDDAVKAREDAERYKLQAQAYENKEIPLAHGKVARIKEQAEAYKSSVIAKAQGEAARFNAVLQAYQNAPDITRERMYLDTLQTVYSKANNIIVATGDKTAPVMYLPLNQTPITTSPTNTSVPVEPLNNTTTTPEPVPYVIQTTTPVEKTAPKARLTR